MEEEKTLERNLDELHGVWGAECHHSGYKNKRGLRWSVDHNYREPSYKPQGEMRGDAGEKSEEAIYPWRVKAVTASW